MPRNGKKVEDSKKKSKKHDEDDIEEIEDEIIDEEAASKKNKKMSSKPKKNKKVAKPETQEEEDELSDLEAVEDEDNGGQDNDAMVSGNKPQRPQRKVIDPKTPIGSLKTDEVLSYLIDVGHNTLNPQLKNGALDLLNQLTGRRRRQPMYNQGQGNFNNRGFGGNRGGRFQPRGMNRGGPPRNSDSNSMQPNFKQQKGGQGEDIYDGSD